MRGVLILVWTFVLVAQQVSSVRAAGVIAGEILDFENGYITLTSGESYQLAANVSIVDAESGRPANRKASTGLFAQLNLDASGHVTQIALSVAPTPSKGALRIPTVGEVGVPLAPAVPPKPQGDFVKVTFLVLVPSTTLPTDQVYMSTSETSWAPTAVRMDRIDGRHFRVIIEVPVGGSFLYLYTRGSPQSLERASNGLQRPARSLTLTTVIPQAVLDAVQHWGDEVGTSLLPPPQTFPTPYNPAPFPNLPPSPRP